MSFSSQIVCLVLVICALSSSEMKLDEENEIKAMVKSWADELSRELRHRTIFARREKAKESFSQAKVVKENWNILVEKLAKNITEMMDEKVKAVEEIKKHVEQLSLYRKPPINVNSSYNFFMANDLYNTTDTLETEEQWEAKYRMFECSVPDQGFCFQEKIKREKEMMKKMEQSDEPYESFDSMNKEYDSFNYKRSLKDINQTICKQTMFIKYSENQTKYLKMEYNPHFDAEVNLDYSIVRVTPGVHNRSTEVINGVRMSEALDLTFKCNYERDPTLTYQYFGSSLGYLRFYPAMQWSDEKYNSTFDFRLRSWYIESISSAKDIIILLDRSGSMTGKNRNMSTEIVNTILDTLTDNDYVNIYTFTNSTEPLVDCFNDTLVQANEENLRLLREQLLFINDKFDGDISLGLEKAFPILHKYREARRGGIVCNQAIMLITEGLDYKYNVGLFNKYNYDRTEKYYKPIRIFTYLIGREPTDAQRMKWIACANMGYYVNITVIEEVREKVLKYLEVMSRPINLGKYNESKEAWTALYVHLADRRLSNYLWKQNTDYRQKRIFVNYGKEELVKNNKTVLPNTTHFTQALDDDDENMEYEYKYLTSVSLPVYDKRANRTELLGVAGVDVPLDYIKQLTEPHRIGVNGYPFIITNNGYVLDHPDHRTVFVPKDKVLKTKILKPTFNRVDFTEVEISDATIEPRKFDDVIIQLREDIVLQRQGNTSMLVRAPIDDMKRVMLQKRHYFYNKIKPFSLVIALPDIYGLNIIKHMSNFSMEELDRKVQTLNNTRYWKVHPKWMYTCKKMHRTHRTPEDEVLHILKENQAPTDCNIDLLKTWLTDASVTEWFDTYDTIFSSSQYRDGLVLTFLSTHAGLTRWMDHPNKTNITDRHFSKRHNKAADEVYYRRSAELNLHKRNMFLYSVPFEDYDENTLITASNVIFQERFEDRAPIAAVGFQIYHKVINNILTTFKCKFQRKTCTISCVNSSWTCYVVDNDGYVVLATNTDLVSKSLREIDLKLMHHLVKDEVFKEITLFDYQDICYVNYTVYRPTQPFYGPSTPEEVAEGLAECKKKQEEAEKYKRTLDYRTKIKCKTIAYLNQRVQKAIPTPCDNELKMYNSMWKSISRLRKTHKNCNCPYITEQIDGSNLMLIAVNGTCCAEKYDETIFPKEINYNLTLPCYIATMNNFTKRHDGNCTIKNKKEYLLNVDNENCGGEDITPVE